ncbi:hypothetical protein EI94DRAFT_1702380 [Lactarius quietus]|nr:hypothetical protein EI94DRAFT_1702380 [Lactarius quietus]
MCHQLLFYYVLAAVPLAMALAPCWDDISVKHTWNNVLSNWESLGPPFSNTTIDLHIALQPQYENTLVYALYDVSTPGNPKPGYVQLRLSKIFGPAQAIAAAFLMLLPSKSPSPPPPPRHPSHCCTSHCRKLVIDAFAVVDKVVITLGVVVLQRCENGITREKGKSELANCQTGHWVNLQMVTSIASGGRTVIIITVASTVLSTVMVVFIAIGVGALASTQVRQGNGIHG